MGLKDGSIRHGVEGWEHKTWVEGWEHKTWVEHKTWG